MTPLYSFGPLLLDINIDLLPMLLKHYLCGISPPLIRSGDISLFVFIREPGVCDVVSIGRERTLGMSVCVWRPFIPVSGVVSWRIISTCFFRFDQFTT